MLDSIKIPRKLALSFLLICASAAVMMAVFYNNFAAIRSATESSNFSQSAFGKAQALETSILRQNSQFRGFLVTGDPSYLKSYREGREEYDTTSAELETMLTDPALKARVVESRRETLAWRKNWGDRLIAMVERGERDQAQQIVRNAGAAVMVSKAVLPLRDVRDAETGLIAQNAAQQESAISTAMTTLVLGGAMLIAIAVGLAMLLSRMIARPIGALTRSMADLATGRNDIAIADTDRGDELGDMARAVLVFRDAAVAKQAADRAKEDADAQQEMVVATLTDHLSRLSGGDLTATIERDFPGKYGAVKANFNTTLSELRGLIAAVADSAGAIGTGAHEIAQASEDLARRTEGNAASLEETAAAISQMDGRLKQTTASARQSAAGSQAAMVAVDDGRSCADDAVKAMERVSESARGIDNVIEGLDKIAFQTRVLAMNAAVEAGRAGDAGRGFAVVADLVSALAMRAEEEARTARDQLTMTQTDIGAAVEAVGNVDRALTAISSAGAEAAQLAERIATDNETQSAAIAEIATAIGTMDQATQQNAAMVEETSAAARNLASEVGDLTAKAGRFETGSRQAAKRQLQAVRPEPAPRPAPVARTLETADGEWQTF